MKMRKMVAGLALGMSLAMSINAFATGSITGIFENVTIVSGSAEENASRTIEIVEKFEAQYFSTDEGIAVKAVIDDINNGSKTIKTAVSDLKKSDDVTVDVDELAMLTKLHAVVIRDQDGNIIENESNVAVSFDLTNIPDGAELYVLLYDATEGFSLHKIKAGAVLGDSVRGIIDGNTLSLLFGDIKGASFAILYKTADSIQAGVTPGADDNSSANTGNVGRVLPVALATVIAGSAVVVFRRKRA